MLVNDLFLRLDLLHVSVVSMTWYKTGKPANGRGWWTYEDRQDILRQCFMWNTYTVMSALSKTNELLVHLYRSFDPRSRSGCITYIEQQRIHGHPGHATVSNNQNLKLHPNIGRDNFLDTFTSRAKLRGPLEQQSTFLDWHGKLSCVSHDMVSIGWVKECDQILQVKAQTDSEYPCSSFRFPI